MKPVRGCGVESAVGRAWEKGAEGNPRRKADAEVLAARGGGSVMLRRLFCSSGEPSTLELGNSGPVIGFAGIRT